MTVTDEASQPDATALASMDPIRRVEAIQRLAAGGAPVDYLAVAVDDNNPFVRAAAAEVLSLYPPQEAAPLLGALLWDAGPSRGPVVHVQAQAIVTIGQLGLVEFADSIEAATTAVDKRKRAAAVRAVQKLGLPSASDVVARALRDESAQVRIRAAEAARDLGNSDLLLPVTEALAAALAAAFPHMSLIKALVTALGVLDQGGTTIQQLLMVARRHPGTRPEVATAVARIGVPSAQYHYRGLLDDGDVALRRFALRGLLALVTDLSPSTRDAVRPVVEDPDTIVQGLAWKVIHRCGGVLEPQELRQIGRTAEDLVRMLTELGDHAISHTTCLDAQQTLQKLAETASGAAATLVRTERGDGRSPKPTRPAGLG